MVSLNLKRGGLTLAVVAGVILGVLFGTTKKGLKKGSVLH